MRRSRLLLVAASSALIAACSYKPSFINEYKIDIQQGNVLTQEMVAQLKPGMTRDQVRFVLGTPLLADVFHADRWDYIYRFRPGKGGSLRMRVSEAASVRVFFSPLPKGRGRAAVRARGKAAKAGPLTLKLGKKKLKAGRYRLTIQATDKSGNRSKPVVRKVKIKS